MSISPGAQLPAVSMSSTIFSTARRSSSRCNRLWSRFETVAGKLVPQARLLESVVLGLGLPLSDLDPGTFAGSGVLPSPGWAGPLSSPERGTVQKTSAFRGR
ncbi:MAG: hypothetical protein ACLQVF_36105, partial [Isosphaeraceae bacterium]